MLECREVPVDAADEGVAGIVPLREGEEFADVDEAHDNIGWPGCLLGWN